MRAFTGTRAIRADDSATLRNLIKAIERSVQVNPLWGRGLFTHHIVINRLLDTVSYCGRFVGATSTRQPAGLTCPTCARRWDAAMLRKNDITRGANTIEHLRVRLASMVADDHVEEFAELWYAEVDDHKQLSATLTEALLRTGSGIAVEDVLEEAVFRRFLS
jgi:hypothetical protein